jgi:tryptophan 2,3-dioxygenase
VKTHALHFWEGFAVPDENLIISDLNYNSYLKIEELLSLQKPLSEPAHHDELFFIIIHQAYELWFKEILHETELLISALRQGSVSRALKVLKRNTAIMRLLVQQIDLLTTLTPVEFAGFRNSTQQALGFRTIGNHPQRNSPRAPATHHWQPRS